MTTWRPILIFALNFIVGALVAQGFVDPAHHDYLVQTLADITGYAIIIITSIASLIHLFKHPHGQVIQKPVEQTTVKTETTTQQVFTQQPALDAGTPPPPNPVQ